MKKTLKFLMLFAIGLFLALSVTSCGDDDDDDTNSSTPSNNGQQGGTNTDSNVTPNPDDKGTNSEPAKNFTVTFNTDGGSEVIAQNVEEGKTVSKPEVPTKEGFYFLGWYVGENVYDFTMPISNDLTITALWMEKTEYDVDLGLPSGTIWATCNVGAENAWDYGDYFAWGETKPKDNYDWSTYKYANGDYDKLTKYCNKSDFGNDGFTDNLTVLQPEDDAATANWGNNWRMPTQAEFQELYDNCDWEWTSDYNGTGVAGRIVKSRSNSNSLFLPVAGYRRGTDFCSVGSDGYYWSSELNTDEPDYGRDLDFYSGGVEPDDWYYRRSGQPVRPVRCK